MEKKNLKSVTFFGVVFFLLLLLFYFLRSCFANCVKEMCYNVSSTCSTIIFPF